MMAPTLSACDERRLARERLGSLRDELCMAEARRAEALREARERCRAERISLHERTRAARLRLEEELREQTKAERDAARAACRERQAAVRAAKDDIERARLALRAEELLQRDLRKSTRAGQTRRKDGEKAVGLGVRGETDDEVRKKLLSELVPLFDRVKKRIKPGPHESRTEAFLRYAERRPDEILVAANDPAEERVRALEAEKARVTKEAKKKGRKGKATKTFLLENLKQRDFVRHGQKIVGERAMGQHAEIAPGKSIRLFGVYPNHTGGPKAYDRTFVLGDEAEYGSYNFIYTGKIVAITKKLVGIQPDGEKRVRRLTIADFSRRNWDFDADLVARRNADTSMTI